MRRVIGGNGVDRAVSDSLQQRLSMLLRAQRRIHFQIRGERLHGLIAEGNVMGRHLAGDVNAGGARLANRGDRPGGGDMRDMQMRARHAGQDHVAGHHRLLRRRGNPAHAQKSGVKPLVHDAAVGEIQILFMGDHRHAQHRRILHRPAHQLPVRHGLTVIADAHAARGTKIGQLRQLFPFQGPAHRTDRIHPARAIPRRLGDDHLRYGPLVVRGKGVGHRADSGVAARYGCASSGGDGLLVLLPRLAQVRVQIDESRDDDEARGIDHFSSLSKFFPDFRDLAIFDEDVDFGVEALARIDNATVVNQNSHG